MRSKGYTVIDILIVVVVLGVAALITIPRMSLAFKDNKEDLYQNQIRLYLEQAKLYGENHKDDFDEEDSLVITIDDLIEEGYIIGDDKDIVYDVRDNTTELNKLKIKMTYDEDKELVDAKIM